MLKSNLWTCCTFLKWSFVIDENKQTRRKLHLKKVKLLLWPTVGIHRLFSPQAGGAATFFLMPTGTILY
jgi:hypothetical protein